MAIVLLGLALIVYLDARMLRQLCWRSRRDGRLFNDVFTVFPVLTTVIAGLVLFHLAIVESSPQTLPQFLFVALLPIYLLRRIRFLKSIGDPSLAPAAPGAFDSTRVLVSDAYNVILIWFLAMVVIGTFFKSIGKIFPAFGSEMGQLLLSAVLSSAIALILIAKASQKFSDGGFFYNVGLRKGDRSVMEVFVAPALVGLFFAVVSSAIIWLRHVQPVTPLSAVVAATDSVWLFAIFLAMAILVAPLIEEIIFRGYFFHVIHRAKGERPAIYVISLVFAFLHVGQYWGDWPAIVMVMLLGFALAILRARTGTTLASIIAHYAYNAGVTIIPFYMVK
jgi:membrane protease YdiL (CAAX protease family)